MLRSLAVTFLLIHKALSDFRLCIHTHTKSEVDAIETKSGMGSLGGIRWASFSAKEVCILSLSLSLPTSSKSNCVQIYYRNCVPSFIPSVLSSLVFWVKGFGEVRLGVHALTNEQVALKFIQKRDMGTLVDAERTVRGLRSNLCCTHGGVWG